MTKEQPKFEIVELHDYLLSQLQNEEALLLLVNRALGQIGYNAWGYDPKFYAFEYPVFLNDEKQGRIDLITTLNTNSETNPSITIIFDLKTWGTDAKETIQQLDKYASSPLIQDSIWDFTGKNPLKMDRGCGSCELILAVIGPKSEKHKYQHYIQTHVGKHTLFFVYVTWEELGWSHQFIHKALYNIKNGWNCST